MPLTPQHIKILIVDDDITSLLMAKAFVKREGYQVITASNGSDAFSRFIEEKPDLILMDVMMPQMNGFEATKAIRQYAGNDNIPILMLTASEDKEAIQNAFDAGATDFIPKQYNGNGYLLTERIRYAIRYSRNESELHKRQEELSFAQSLAKVGYIEWDAENDIIYGSEFTLAMFECTNTNKPKLEELIDKAQPENRSELLQIIKEIEERTYPKPNIEMRFQIQLHNNQQRHLNCLIQADCTLEGERCRLTKLRGSVQDITQLYSAEQKIEEQSTHDNLTKLLNRKSFISHLSTKLNGSLKNQSCMVVVFDIDRFKHINSSIGQEIGDELLIGVGHRLASSTREDDWVARIGSDEFAILIHYSDKDINHKETVIKRFQEQLNQPFEINGHTIFNSYSIGIACFPSDAQDANTLLNFANSARSRAKQYGGNQFVFYNSSMDKEMVNLISMEAELRTAIHQDQIKVYYQPQIYARDQSTYGAEALVRWHHPTKGIIPPLEFISLAESTGLIVDIGRIVMNQALSDAKEWHDQGYPIHIGVNVSGRQFLDPNLMRDVHHALHHSQLPPEYVDLEITESLAMDDVGRNIKIFNQLKALGIAVSLDDFGTGYSSLAYLHKFPIKTIKIDRSFILNLDNTEGQEIANTIILLARSLNLDVIAEGVSEPEHYEFMHAKECDIIQGFLFGKPMPKAQFTEWLANNKK